MIVDHRKNLYNNEYMTSYLLFFRDGIQESNDEQIKAWDEYIGKIAREGRFVSGLPFGPKAKMITGTEKKVLDFTVDKGAITEYIIIRANTMEEAVEVAKGAPNLQLGGSVEIRSTIPPVQ